MSDARIVRATPSDIINILSRLRWPEIQHQGLPDTNTSLGWVHLAGTREEWLRYAKRAVQLELYMLGGEGHGWPEAQDDVARKFPGQQLRELKRALKDLVKVEYSAVNTVPYLEFIDGPGLASRVDDLRPPINRDPFTRPCARALVNIKLDNLFMYLCDSVKRTNEYQLEAYVEFIWTNELFRLRQYLLDAVSHNWTHSRSVTQYSILKDIQDKIDALHAAHTTVDEFWLDLIEEYSRTDVAHGSSLMRALHKYDHPFPWIPELEDMYDVHDAHSSHRAHSLRKQAIYAHRR